jgi:hypothetical protein
MCKEAIESREAEAEKEEGGVPPTNQASEPIVKLAAPCHGPAGL